MYSGIMHAHSGLRWVLLLFIVIVLFNALTRSGIYGDREKRLALLAMIFAHVQLVLGLILYFISPKVEMVAGFMKVPQYRFFAVEHFLGMLVGIILITIGRKRALLAATPNESNKKLAIFFGIGLLIILAMIPWPFRENLGAGWY